MLSIIVLTTTLRNGVIPSMNACHGT